MFADFGGLRLMARWNHLTDRYFARICPSEDLVDTSGEISVSLDVIRAMADLNNLELSGLCRLSEPAWAIWDLDHASGTICDCFVFTDQP
jgi:hypothetical protein